MNGQALTIEHAVLAVAALEFATWQGSTFNYYYVYYRKLTAGDTTSNVHESEAKGYAWDDPRVVQVLLRLYKIIYGWQDALLGWLDRAITPDRGFTHLSEQAPAHRRDRYGLGIPAPADRSLRSAESCLLGVDPLHRADEHLLACHLADPMCSLPARQGCRSPVPATALVHRECRVLRGMKGKLPRYWPAQQAYHHARADLYRRIIADCRLPPPTLILDAACGDAFYSDLLASMVGPRARVLAADFNLAALRSRPFSSAGVMRCLTDVEQAGLRSSFDVVWMCRSMHSAADPQQRVSALAGLLRPGGRLIVVENDPFHCSIPAWSAEFERTKSSSTQWNGSFSGAAATVHRSIATRPLATCRSGWRAPGCVRSPCAPPRSKMWCRWRTKPSGTGSYG